MGSSGMGMNGMNGVDPALSQVMNILSKQRGRVFPYGPMGIPGGGVGWQGDPPREGTDSILDPPDGGVPAPNPPDDDYWVNPGPVPDPVHPDPVDNRSDVPGSVPVYIPPGSDPGDYDNPPDVDYSVPGADYPTPQNDNPASWPDLDFNPFSFLTDMPIAEQGDWWQQVKNVFGGVTGMGQFIANPFQVMISQGIQQGTDALFDKMYSSGPDPAATDPTSPEGFVDTGEYDYPAENIGPDPNEYNYPEPTPALTPEAQHYLDALGRAGLTPDAVEQRAMEEYRASLDNGYYDVGYGNPEDYVDYDEYNYPEGTVI